MVTADGKYPTIAAGLDSMRPGTPKCSLSNWAECSTWAPPRRGWRCSRPGQPPVPVQHGRDRAVHAREHPRGRPGGRRAPPVACRAAPAWRVLRGEDHRHGAGRRPHGSDPRPGERGDGRAAPDRSRGCRDAGHRHVRRPRVRRGGDRDDGAHLDGAVRAASGALLGESPGSGDLPELRQGIAGDLLEGCLVRVVDPLLEGDLHDDQAGAGGESGGGVAESPFAQCPGHGGGQ
jgi:hypothetical protein